jgi:hypothetical protein
MATFSHRADIPPVDRTRYGRLPFEAAPVTPVAPPRRDPTAARAVGRTTDRPAPSAPVPELRSRLSRAVQVADGAAALLLAHHIRRAAG